MTEVIDIRTEGKGRRVEMPGPDPRGEFERQGYHFIGQQAAVKSCHWTKNSLAGGEPCYKQKFYGINSHQCIQMTPAIVCNHGCLHCWRPVGAEFGQVQWDPPGEVAARSIGEQRRLLSGYGGNPLTPGEKFGEAMAPRHVAISLDGEPALYPHLPQLIEEYHRRGFTTFVVTNGSRPEVLRQIRPTQLYISMNAPDEPTYQREVQPTSNTWPRFLQSLDAMREQTCRTVIRVTVVKGLNDHHPEEYARLIRRANPWFIEVKGYMHVGYSRQRLERTAMPDMDRIRAFALRIEEHLQPQWHIEDESEASRVVMMMREGVERRLQL